MSAAHTPGPWTLTHRGGSNFAVQTFEVRGMFGGSPNIYPIFNRGTDAIDSGVIHTSPEDARLIAAAPEMLEALERLVRAGRLGADALDFLNAERAIAKARGEA